MENGDKNISYELVNFLIFVNTTEQENNSTKNL